MQRSLILAILIICSSSSFASILPENNLAIPVSDKSDGLTEAQYHSVINKVDATYRPIVEALGKKLIMNRLWENSRVNAGTLLRGNEWVINLYGGYARHPLVTEDAYALVICHELGHHLGGTPKKVLDGTNPGWPSVEGQADYFATLKCLRKVFRKDDNRAAISQLVIPDTVSQKCGESFKTDWEIAMCIRTTMAGLSVAAISSDVRYSEIPTIESPDASVVDSTYEAHPAPQCRLDTYFQGSICEVSSTRQVSIDDETKGTCHESLGHISGLRPACWFKSNGNVRRPLPGRP